MVYKSVGFINDLGHSVCQPKYGLMDFARAGTVRVARLNNVIIVQALCKRCTK